LNTPAGTGIGFFQKVYQLYDIPAGTGIGSFKKHQYKRGTGFLLTLPTKARIG
jgi:hypothetical protein